MLLIQDRPAALPGETHRATVSPISRFRLAANATEHLMNGPSGRAFRNAAR
jgi:hypothetical protein